MKPRSDSSPLPSQAFIPIFVSEQASLPGFEPPFTEVSLWEFESALSDGLLSALHTYGVTLSRLELLYFGELVFAHVWLKAGNWEREETFGANRQKHPVRTLCAKILRFVKRENENLE